MTFTDLTAALEEMEYLVQTTGRSHMIAQSATRSDKYHVLQRNGGNKSHYLIAELNCRNVVGEKKIRESRASKMRRVVGKDKARA